MLVSVKGCVFFLHVGYDFVPLFFFYTQFWKDSNADVSRII